MTKETIPNLKQYKKPSLQKEKILSEKDIEDSIKRIENIIMPLYEEIEKLRKENPNREVGGNIINGKIELVDESRWKESSVIGEKYEKERAMAKKGFLSFHTHGEGLSNFSAPDILAAYFRLHELIFHKEGITLLLALKELPIEVIKELDKQAWKEAEDEELKWGDEAYWFWKDKLQKKLPLRVIEIVDKNKHNKLFPES